MRSLLPRLEANDEYMAEKKETLTSRYFCNTCKGDNGQPREFTTEDMANFHSSSLGHIIYEKIEPQRID